MKKYLFLLIFSIVFWNFFLIDTASIVNASTLTTWQNMVSNGTTTLFWYSGSGLNYDIFLNLFYEFDLSNFPYWQATDTDAWHFRYLNLKQPTTPLNWDYSITIPTNSEGYKFWSLMTKGVENETRFLYKSGGNQFINICIKQKDITLADKTLGLWKCDGVGQNPITNISFTTAITYAWYAENIYLMVYTDDNLDTLIYDETSMYDYLNNLTNYNALFGGWSSTTPMTLPAGTCENLDVFAGALCKVITFLFVPTSGSLNQFSNLKDIIATKPPFGYFTSIKGYLSNLSSTSTPAFVLTPEIANIPLFNTIKTGLIWILWLFFGIFVIKRIARFDF